MAIFTISNLNVAQILAFPNNSMRIVTQEMNNDEEVTTKSTVILYVVYGSKEWPHQYIFNLILHIRNDGLNQILKRQTSRFHYGSKVPAITITVFITILEQNR
jgi:hypothetical protein